MGGILGTENQVLTLEMFPFPDLHPQVEGLLEIEWKPSRDPLRTPQTPTRRVGQPLGLMSPPRGRSPCATLRGVLPHEEENRSGARRGGALAVRGDESAPPPGAPRAPKW